MRVREWKEAETVLREANVMHTADYQYKQLLSICLDGDKVQTRNSVCYRAQPGLICEFDRTPLVTARKTPWKTALREWEWFMSGSNDIREAHPSVRPWWEPFTVNGLMVNSYAKQMRDCAGYDDHTGASTWVDQINRLVDGIRNHPYSRRNVMTLWHGAEMWHPSTKLTTCHHTVTQCFVRATGQLDLVTYQRSADVVVGLPANWMQTWAFLLWLCARTDRQPGRVQWIGGDIHVYECHRELAQRIIDVGPPTHLPELFYTPASKTFRADEFGLSEEYKPVILERAEMVV
jgi:thymidylate synthase